MPSCTGARQLASALLGLGLAPGDRVGIWSHNNAEWVLMQLATAQVGIILVNINPAYRTAEVEYALNKVGCKALVAMPQFKTSDYLGMLRELAPELADHTPGQLEACACPRCAPWCGSMLADEGDDQPGMVRFRICWPKAMPRMRASTRSRPRCEHRAHQHPVHQRHHGLSQGRHADAPQHPEQRFLHRRGMAHARDRLCIPVPLYHCFGMVLGNLACFTHG
jgi:fatty-acyl-CoA synthase